MNSTVILTEAQHAVLMTASEWVATSPEGQAFLAGLPAEQRQTYIETLTRIRAAVPQSTCTCGCPVCCTRCGARSCPCRHPCCSC